MAGRADRLEERLGHRFAMPVLLRQALTHASAGAPAVSNERLEFLGDRVLGVVVAHLLFERFPNETEGALARRFAALTRRETLARVAASVDLGEHLILSASEVEAGGRANPGTLADACEAVIAALYLDGGPAAAEAFVRREWLPLLDEALPPPKDAKTALQEWAQDRGLPLPVYRETGRSGPAHAPVFSIEVAVQGQKPVVATGASKRAAEQGAAKGMLRQLGAGPP
jgi:ribonuclease-3